jgi:hypothetical protein
MTKAAGPPNGYEYAGSELSLFEKATNWKRYWRDEIEPYVRGDVLEVGAGIGANTQLLSDLPHRTWTCLEPDATLAGQIEIHEPVQRRVIGTLTALSASDRFDTILYIDVLEHIEDDRSEMIHAAERLSLRGHLIVLSPAHDFLFTEFDAAIGHFRRYSRETLRAAAAPTCLQELRMDYIDSAGVLASAANRLLLNQSMPNERQILTWDRHLVPLSRFVDPILRWSVGKSVLGVWRRDI